jgi:hypothetical protein
MSLTMEGLEAVRKEYEKLEKRVSELCKKLGVPMVEIDSDHYGRFYIFGKSVYIGTLDKELTKIIKDTPDNERLGYLDFFGGWHNMDCTCAMCERLHGNGEEGK